MSGDTDADFLLRFLAGRDRPCPGCGYNLRDLPSALCPECGQQLTLSLRLVEPRQGALLTGLIGLASGCGMGGLMLLFAAIMTFVMGRGSGGGLGQFLLVNGAGFLVHAVAVFFWLRHWNDIRTLPVGIRRILVLFCWALPLAFVVVFAAYIR